MRDLFKFIVNSVFIYTLLSLQLAHADIARSQLTSAIEAREPTDDLTDFVQGKAGEITTVYFFNHVTKMNGQTVVHKWFLNGEEKAVVQLPIGSDNWRTYSSKRLNSVLQGQWEVQVWVNNEQRQAHRFTFEIRD
ncbi:DUF2914 domain-containing protein [Alteromonas sp. a30]|uniref:DUF2914 domain-containing protein n=1 Tax=Alteromonas sp. a30 TaxID=2730917 RepID=UPI00227F85C1|nr:DUF2914 domain-containing protein [Alteromonas sp. a30]MCY7296255.1 DUF2914 domain-containing protein [Alteromonas sp. a30]